MRVCLPLLHEQNQLSTAEALKHLKATFSWKFILLQLSLFIMGFEFPSWRKKSLLSYTSQGAAESEGATPRPTAAGGFA